MINWGWFMRQKYVPKVIIYPEIGKLTENFDRSEFDCKDGTVVPYKYRFNLIELAVNLQVIRNDLGAPIVISSGYRTPTHNEKEGGSTTSLHLIAGAGDMHQSKESPLELYNRVLNLIRQDKVKDGGLFLYNWGVHYDIGPAGRRGNYSTLYKL